MATGMSEADAFGRLQKTAMDKRLSLRQVAEAVILASETGAGGGADGTATQMPASDHDLGSGGA